jgi:hypothetical protein
MGYKLTGLGELTKNLEQLKRALDGEVACLKFDANSGEGVERAIRHVEQRVDIKVAAYISSPGAREIATELEAEYRKTILQKARHSEKPLRRSTPARYIPGKRNGTFLSAPDSCSPEALTTKARQGVHTSADRRHGPQPP